MAEGDMTAPSDGLVLRADIEGKRFPAVGGAPARPVLGAVRLSLQQGEVAALTGPSGCGKTTLLNLVAGLDRDFQGRIELPGNRRLAYVFQEPRLLPWRTVEQNLALVLHGRDDAGPVIDRVLGEVGLRDAAGTFASRLSLGMARRVALARAFVVEPDLLLLDEPFASLDQPTARRLRLLLLDLLERRRATALFVTHDLEEAVMLGRRLVSLGGRPARITADVAIPLTASERRDPRAVASHAARLCAAADVPEVA